MSNQDEVLAAIKSTKIASVRKATQDQSYTPEELEALYHAAVNSGREPIIAHISALGELSPQALQRGLLTLAMHGHDKPLIARLDHIQDVNQVDKHGRTLLSYAMVHGKQALVEQLCAQGADPNLEDADGRSPLSYGCVANKGKAVKHVLEHCEVRVQGESGRALIDAAPTKPIKEALFALYVAQYTSQMTKEAFIARWGEVGEVNIGLGRYEAPNGEPIMKGKMWTTGYAKRGVDPRTSDQPWDAIDRAKTLAHQLADILNTHKCRVINSEGSAPYYPFFIPLLGRITKTADLDAEVSQEAKDAASGAYAQRIERFEVYGGLFDQLADHFEDEEDAAELAAFRQVNALANAQLKQLTKQRVYSDFVTFPTIFGGLNEDGSFVGVIVEAAWT